MKYRDNKVSRLSLMYDIDDIDITKGNLKVN